MVELLSQALNVFLMYSKSLGKRMEFCRYSLVIVLFHICILTFFLWNTNLKNIYSKNNIKSVWNGIWVNNDSIFIFGWTVSLCLLLFDCFLNGYFCSNFVHLNPGSNLNRSILVLMFLFACRVARGRRILNRLGLNRKLKRWVLWKTI